MAKPALPAAYAWLAAETGPRVLVEALALYGTKETAGSANNAAIMAWARETGLDRSYNADSIPWCGLFVALVVRRAGFEPVANPLWARNWATFGTKANRPSLGDVLVFVRDSGGHVGLYVGEDASSYFVLGGNQGDAVSIARIAKARCIAVRRCPWRVSQADIAALRREVRAMVRMCMSMRSAMQRAVDTGDCSPLRLWLELNPSEDVDAPRPAA